MEFKYKAIDQSGGENKGVKSSENKYSLATDLKKEGLILLDAEEVGAKGKFSLQMSFGGFSTHEKIIFARNLSSMLDAGLALSRALNVIERQTKKSGTKKIISEIGESIKKGSSLNESLSKHPKVFDNLFISMVKAGEESGKLSESLEEIANQTEKVYLLKKKIKGAMIYPGVIISAMIVIGIFMMIFIVPTLTGTFESLELDLPASTRFIIGVSEFFQANILTSLIVVFLAIVAFFVSIKSKKGKIAFNYIMLHIPVISGIVKESNSARTTRTLASLLQSGVPYLTSIQITKEVIDNHFYKKVLSKVEKNVEMGSGVSKVFAENEKLYPAFVSEMIAVGEETGELSPMLLKVASFYENEVEQKTKNMSTIVEPFLMIIVGGAVGFFALSMITPMYSLVDAL